MQPSFLQESSPEVARQLLGWRFYRQSPSGLVGGTIVETEAYTGQDAASHSYRGQTARNQIMFGPAGFLYVYFTYGLHYCANIVTGPTGSGEAVLLRALLPDEGLDVMRQRRQRPDAELTNGPAKLCQALAIGKHDNGKPINGPDFLLLEPTAAMQPNPPSRRIGITQNADALWRFTAQI